MTSSGRRVAADISLQKHDPEKRLYELSVSWAEGGGQATVCLPEMLLLIYAAKSEKEEKKAEGQQGRLMSEEGDREEVIELSSDSAVSVEESPVSDHLQLAEAELNMSYFVEEGNRKERKKVDRKEEGEDLVEES